MAGLEEFIRSRACESCWILFEGSEDFVNVEVFGEFGTNMRLGFVEGSTFCYERLWFVRV